MSEGLLGSWPSRVRATVGFFYVDADRIQFRTGALSFLEISLGPIADVEYPDFTPELCLRLVHPAC